MAFLWMQLLCVVSFVTLYLKCKIFKFYVRVSLFPLCAFVSTTVLLPWAVLDPHPKTIRKLGSMLRFARPLMGIDCEMEGCENLGNKPYVIVVNHRSHLDLLCLLLKYHWFSPCAPVAKDEVRYLTLSFGWFLNLCGTIFLKRSSPKEAQKQMLQKVEYLKTTSTSVIIFPEGTRNHSANTLLPFKKGAFHLALAAKMPILPVVISNYSSFYSTKEKRFDDGRVILKVLPEIPTENLRAEDVDDLLQETYERMKKAKEEFKTVLVS